MKPAITVRNLSKKYELGLTHTDLLSEKLGNGLRAIGRRFGRKGKGGSNEKASKREPEANFWALKNINFEVQQGEVIGVIGRNGAGKSTLLKIISRITAPTTGEVELQGQVASLLEVGTGFHSELTGRENIFLNGAILGMKRQEIKNKFDAIVSFAEVEKFIDTPVKRYSSGMYVRLAFAVAAHLEPEILVVDEVLAVGDLAFQKKCLSKMEDVSGAGRTVLFVSHNMASIKRLCRKSILLNAGQLEAFGESHEVISRYYETGQTSESAVVFNDVAHKVRTEIQISGIAVLADNTSASQVIYQNDPISICFKLNVRKTFANARIGIEIYKEGVLVTTIQSPPTRFDEATESTTKVCHIPGSTLLPGFYDLHIGALDLTTNRSLDWIPDAFTLQVLDLHSEIDTHYDEREKGMVRIQATWTG